MLDLSGRVVYIGSFSKTTLASLRLGFIVAPPSLRGALHGAKFLTDWHSPVPLQASMADFIAEGHFARHVRRMRIVYEIRHRLINNILGSKFADELQMIPAAAGLHISAPARDASIERLEAIVRSASRLGVECQTLSMYSHGLPGRAGLVLGYGAIATGRIDAGLLRLRRCFDDIE